MVAANTKIREKPKQQRTGRRSCGCFSSTRRRILLIGSFISFIIWSYTILKIIQNLRDYFDNDERSTRRKDNYTDYTSTEYQLDAPTTPYIYNYNRNRINNDNDSRVVVETETNNKTKTTKTKTETKKMTDIQRYRIKQEQERLRQRRHQENASLLLIHDENDNNNTATAAATAATDNTLGVLAPQRYTSFFDFANDDDNDNKAAATATTDAAADVVVVVDLTAPPPPKTTTIKHISIVGTISVSNDGTNHSTSTHYYSPRIVGLIDDNDTNTGGSSSYSFQHYKTVKKISRLNEKKIKNNNKQNKYWQEQEHPTHSQNIPRSHTEDVDQLQHQLYVNQQSNNYKQDCIYPGDDTADDQEATDFYAVYQRVRCSSNSKRKRSEEEDDERSGSGSGDDDDCERSGDSDDEDDEWSIVEQLDPSSNSKSKTTSSYSYSSKSKSNNKDRVWQKRNYPVCNTMHELGILGNEVGNTAMVNIEVLGKGSYRTAYLLDNIYPHSHPHQKNKDEDEGDEDNDETRDDDDDNDNDDSKIVIKMFGLDTDHEFPFDIASFEMHRVDSVISQKMTASPYILDIYGHCGVSGLYEQGYDDLHHIAKNRRRHRNNNKDHHHHHHHTRTPELTLETKMQYSYEAIQAIYDLHTIDYDDDDEYSSSLSSSSSSSSKTAVVIDPIGRPATIIHGDIKPENFILVQLGKGKKKTFRLKLNDFNYSILRKFNRTAIATSSTSITTATASSAGTTATGDSKKEQVEMHMEAACPYYTNQVPLSWGVGYRPYEFSIDNYPPINENIDIFGLGGVLYYILEGKDPYWQYTKDHEVEEISKGLLPPISATTTTKRIVNSKTDTDDIDTRRTIKTIIDIIQKSMSLNTNDRPTSKQVLEQFRDVYSL
jgi:hypothetical protein